MSDLPRRLSAGLLTTGALLTALITAPATGAPATGPHSTAAHTSREAVRIVEPTYRCERSRLTQEGDVVAFGCHPRPEEVIPDAFFVQVPEGRFRCAEGHRLGTSDLYGESCRRVG